MRLFALIAAMLIILPVVSAALIQPMSVPTVEPKIIQRATIIQVPSCATGDSKCDGSKFLRCISNRWQTEDECSSFEICDSNKGCLARTTPATEIRHITKLPATPIVSPEKIAAIKHLDIKQRLVCPTVTKSPVAIPAPFGDNDCALIGKSDEVEKYLQELESIAAKCTALKGTVWQAVQNAQADLGNKIDNLVVPEIDPKLLQAKKCGIYSDAEPHKPPVESISLDESIKYTESIRRISKKINEYCGLIDELMKPVRGACNEINFYLNCEPPNKNKYHTILKNRMQGADTQYKYADSFYNENIQAGLDSFRKQFSEEDIYCPPPVITQVQDDVEYEKDEGESKEDLGRVKIKVPWHRRLFGWFGFNPQPEPPARPAEFKPAEFKPGEKEGFNPQPEPPGIPTGEEVGFNPQPEPPGKPAEFKPGEKEGFNPQPEPPGAPTPGEEVGFNPQPEPPGKGGFMNFLKNLFTKN